MGRRNRLANVLDAGGVTARTVAEPRRAPGLVQGDPTFDRIAQGACDDVDVLAEPFGGVTSAPAALVFERLWEVPVIQGQRGLDASRHEPVDESAVEVQAGLIGRSLAVRLHSGPRDRESVRADAERLQEGEVLVHPVIVVTRDVAGVAIPDLAGAVAVGIPNRRSTTVD